jgi:hypothetical protein
MIWGNERRWKKGIVRIRGEREREREREREGIKKCGEEEIKFM